MDLFVFRENWLTNLFLWEEDLPSLIMLIIELTFISLLYWARNDARKLNLKRKLKIIFTIVPLNIIVWFFYMGPKGFFNLNRILNTTDNPIEFNILSRYHVLLHGTFGALTMISATFLLVVMSLVLFLNSRKTNTKPVMVLSKKMLVFLYVIWSFVLLTILYFVYSLEFELRVLVFGLTVIVILILFKYINELNLKIPLPMIRRMKPLMITTFVLWNITVLLGTILFINFKIVEIIPSLV